MRVYRQTAILSLFIAFWCCEENSLPDGAYEYVGYDTNEVQIIEGWFNIEEEDSSGISGTWEFKSVNNPDYAGIHIGDGVFAGWIDSNHISIELYPGYRDHNVNLSGTMTNERIEGEWTTSGFAGPINHGTFHAEK